MIIGTAGHIDHGKTALVRALTGVDTDRLAEEKARGISIDLGYAYVPQPDGDTLGFIDVPGHERLVHNMLAGATGIDLALLVIAADDGVMPQTREHLAILCILGVQRAVVALTKIDLVDAARREAVEQEIGDLLQSTPMAGAPVFAVSNISGAGIDALRAHLISLSGQQRVPPDERGFRLAVDRCFVLGGVGVVVTGTVFAGQVTVGESILLTPSGISARVRSLHAQNKAAQSGSRGQRCALNLAGSEVERDRIRRGDWAIAPQLHAPTTRLDARIRLLPGERRALATWQAVRVYLGACEAMAHAVPLAPEALNAGEQGLVQLVFEAPIHAVLGDRIVLRDHTGSLTLGGGDVLDPHAPARKRRTPGRLAVLEALTAPDLASRLARLLELSPRGLDLGRCARAWNVAPDHHCWHDQVPHRVEVAGTVHGFSQMHWNSVGERLLETLHMFHLAHADEPGPERDRLRRMAAPDLDRAVYLFLVRELAQAGALVAEGPWLRLPGHEASLTRDQQALAGRILPHLTDADVEPPWVRGLAQSCGAPEAQVRGLLQALARRGELYQVVRDLFYTPHQVEQLAHTVAALEQRDGTCRAAAFRDATGLGRKRAIQVLEFFDRIGYTRRAGEGHRLRQTGAVHGWNNRAISASSTPG